MTFSCSKCRAADWELTGRQRALFRSHTRSTTPDRLNRQIEYDCRACGHTGWTRRSAALAGLPDDADAIRPTYEPLPLVLAELADLIGEEAACRLVSLATEASYAASGRRHSVRIPRDFADAGALVEAIGEAHTRTLVYAYGGQWLDLPALAYMQSWHERALMRMFVARGATYDELAVLFPRRS